MNMMEGLMQCAANYVPLTPISFLERAARVYPNQNSLVCGKLTFTWKQTHERCIKLASSLSSHGLSYGDFVVALIPNIPELYELHFGVAMAGGVLCTLNPRLDATTLSSILEDINPKFIFLDHQNIHPFNQALKTTKLTDTPLLVLTSSFPKQKSPPNSLNYNDLLDIMVHNNFEPKTPKNECDPILVNYTSGSTGHPKGVAYSHRATYLNTLGEVLRSNLRENSKVVFLWTADMFRANGWGFIWAIAAVGGTNVINLRTMNNNNDFCNILKSICFHKVTHLSGHPHLLSTIIEEHNTTQLKIPHKVYAHVAGVLQASSDDLVKIQHLGFEVVHRYGMTEILGPPLILNNNNNNNNKCLNHNNHNIMEEFDIKDPTTMESVPQDGKTIGEVMFRGNAMMMGYYKCLKETEKVFSKGWFHTGDLAVRHQDGCIQLKDRVLDAIIVVSSQGKTVIISSLEIEAVLLTHPMVQQAAVVAMPLTHHHHHYDDDHNDDHNDNDDDDEVVVPCAFLKLKIGCDATQKEIIQFCSERSPNYMVPRVVNFGNLAVSSTGKVQKFILREAAKLLSINMSSKVTTPIELN